MIRHMRRYVSVQRTEGGRGGHSTPRITLYSTTVNVRRLVPSLSAHNIRIPALSCTDIFLFKTIFKLQNSSSEKVCCKNEYSPKLKYKLLNFDDFDQREITSSLFSFLLCRRVSSLPVSFSLTMCFFLVYCFQVAFVCLLYFSWKL